MLEIIWETAELALCVKPIGVRAQGEGEIDLPALLSRQLGCSIYPVHRLDQAVGGVMVFVWKYLVKPIGGVFGIYELLPAFVAGLLTIVVVSLCTKAPSQEITDEVDEVVAMGKATKA